MLIDRLMFYALILVTFLAVVTFVMGVRAFFDKRYVEKRLTQVLDQLKLSVFNSNNRMFGRRWNAILGTLSKL